MKGLNATTLLTANHDEVEIALDVAKRAENLISEILKYYFLSHSAEDATKRALIMEIVERKLQIEKITNILQCGLRSRTMRSLA